MLLTPHNAKSLLGRPSLKKELAFLDIITNRVSKPHIILSKTRNGTSPFLWEAARGLFAEAIGVSGATSMENIN
jgi:hypothetical protein